MTEADAKPAVSCESDPATSADVLIIGMCRSGTSLTAQIVRDLGIGVGDPTALYAADKWNSEGYIERSDVVALNDQVLAAAGGHYMYPPATEDIMREIPRFIGEARAIAVQARRESGGRILLKDPRMCLTLPLWLSALDCPRVLFVVRNPLEVAESLALQGWSDRPRNAALWERYLVDSIRFLSTCDPLVVQYQELLNRSEESISAIAKFLGIDRQFTVSNIKLDLYRARAVDDDHGALAQRQLEIFNALTEEHQKPDLLVDRFDQVSLNAQSLLQCQPIQIDPQRRTHVPSGNSPCSGEIRIERCSLLNKLT